MEREDEMQEHGAVRAIVSLSSSSLRSRQEELSTQGKSGERSEPPPKGQRADKLQRRTLAKATGWQGGRKVI